MVDLAGPCLIRRRISPNSVISMWRNNKSCKCISIFLLKNSPLRLKLIQNLVKRHWWCIPRRVLLSNDTRLQDVLPWDLKILKPLENLVWVCPLVLKVDMAIYGCLNIPHTMDCSSTASWKIKENANGSSRNFGILHKLTKGVQFSNTYILFYR